MLALPTPDQGPQPDVYKSLGLGDRDFRLFELEPDCPQASNQIQGKLVVRSVDSGCEYEALSYVWGGTPGDGSPTIIVNDVKIRITENLHNALRGLSKLKTCQTLWIDAICIDQSDDREKSGQIMIMGDIYARASNVHIWLGEGFLQPEQVEEMDAIKWAMWILRYFTFEYTQMSKEIFPQKGNAIALGLRIITQRPWFYRVWVVQEAMLAKRITIHCEQEIVELSRGVQALRFTRRLKLASISPRWLGVKWDDAESFKSILAPLIELMQLSATDTHGKRPELDILDLLYSMSHRKATDPRDRIFGLIGLTNCAEPMRVDYTLDESALWDQLLEHLKSCPGHPGYPQSI